MDDAVKITRPKVRVRAFRAIDEPETCMAFVQGHADVLTSIGIKKVTSSKHEWTANPAVFVIVVEALDGSRVFGGARVHVAGGTEYLPIEQAISKLDPTINELVWQYAQTGSGEICGLWNSKDMAGYGLGTPILIRSGIAIASQLGIQTLFALCAPYTVQPVVNCGMELVDKVGNKGTFYYPKLDLIATAMVLNDLLELSKANADARGEILKMRADPDGFKLVDYKKDIDIDFKLKVPNLDKWNLNEIIDSAYQLFLESQSKKAVTY
ncbi:GNAT family protein [Mucilaginibacter auburnensis]|nr:hypothetical protein [Mucilaginibacter auburnensis]